MKISPRSRAYKATAQRLGFNAVCLIGWDGPRPASFGDNRGIYPVRVATSTKEGTAHERADLESPHVGIVMLEYVLVPSATHAKRLKDALDEVLLGQAEEHMNNTLRHRWRDVRECWDQDNSDPAEQEFDRARWWSVVLDEARRILSGGATEFEIYESAEEAQDIITKAVKRGR